MDLPKNTTRDPRFDSLGNGAPVDEHKIARNYAFLEDYREDEMRVLKEEVKKEKDEDRKWELEQRLKSMVYYIFFYILSRCLFSLYSRLTS